MSATHVFTLSLEGPLRSGLVGEERSSLPARSDTVMAALRCVALETGTLAEAFAGPAPPFRVSSLFSEAGGVRLYPRPLAFPFAPLEEGGREELIRRESWSGLSHVTEARLESLAEGRRVRLEAEDVVGDRVWGMPSERAMEGLPRLVAGSGIAVDRGGGPPERFRRTQVALPRGSRAFFLARLEESALLAPLRELVERLGEAGLGAGRAAGAGHFTLSGAHPAPGFLAEAAEGAAGDSRGLLLLSLYLPTREEAARGVLDGASAELELRGGWIHSGGPTAFRKRPVRMLVEGTTLRPPAGGVEGEVRDVGPPGFDRHPVWRDGRAFAIAYRGPS